MKKEQLYTIPLGKAYLYTRTKRTMRTIKLLREFVIRHSKRVDVRISLAVNEFLWLGSMQHPPRKVRVKVISDDKMAYVYLPDEKIEAEKPEEVKATDKKVEGKPEAPKESKIEAKKEVAVKAEPVKEVKVEAKKEVKPEAKVEKEVAKKTEVKEKPKKEEKK